VRCAVYTRKSSDEELDQELNSLQAQSEACQAFINSQRHEGWVDLRCTHRASEWPTRSVGPAGCRIDLRAG
jgi:DNA invertase Pin-like site-specific DNA recombinase